MTQLSFDLPLRAATGRDAFFVSPANETALAAIDAWRGWPDGRLAVVGPESSGKSHLARVWADLASARVVDAARTLIETRGLAVDHDGRPAVYDVDLRVNALKATPDKALRASFRLHSLRFWHRSSCSFSGGFSCPSI